MIEALGNNPINTAVTVGLNSFVSVFRRKPSQVYGEEDIYPRPYNAVRGIMINKEHLDATPVNLDRGYYFQFNPTNISDVKNTLYEVRKYAGLPYNDYIWEGGGERIISFQLFLDNTPQSKTAYFRPTAYKGQNFGFAEANKINSSGNTSKIEYEGNAFSNTRVSERGILHEVELIQSFMYPAPLTGETTPLFYEGGIVTSTQFRPPAVVVLCIGPLYLEGVVKSAPVDYTLFDQDLTPIRGTINVEFAVFEFSELTRKIDWNSK